MQNRLRLIYPLHHYSTLCGIKLFPLIQLVLDATHKLFNQTWF